MNILKDGSSNLNALNFNRDRVNFNELLKKSRLKIISVR